MTTGRRYRRHGSLRLFDESPIKIGGFILTSTGAEPIDDSIGIMAEGWLAAWDYSTASEEAVQFWVADLWNYAKHRPELFAQVESYLDDRHVAHQTRLNIASVGSRVQGEARALAPSFSHADAVAKLEHSDQVEVLKQARDEGWSSHETRKAVQRRLRPRVVEGQAELKGKYRVILADPPWEYDNSLAMPDGSQTPAASSYQGMTIADICALPVEAHAMKNAVLFMWITNSHLLENPGPRDVIEAWGFKYKTNYVWDKVVGRPGHYSYVQHEMLAVCTRGSATPDVNILQHDHASIQTVRRKGEHSEKPVQFHDLIRKLYTEGPYLELFARRPREGWSAFGNDARVWLKKAKSA